MSALGSALTSESLEFTAMITRQTVIRVFQEFGMRMLGAEILGSKYLPR